jgi:hypothetical protein
VNRCQVTGKIRYLSEDHAKRRMRNVSNRLRVYRCQYCKDLHVCDAEKGGGRDE